MKKALLAVLAIGTFSAMAVPAQADNANIQRQNQTSITTGDRNVSTLEGEQTILDRRINSRENSGNVQSGSQFSDVLGSDNDTYQRDRQEINETSRNRPSSRR